jgi:diguanylate cyclase (GGDEF)-like protein
VADKIRALISESPFATRTGAAPVTVSVGVASTGPHGPDLALKVEALIRCADECLYRSKQAGRNCTTGVEIAVAPALVAHG